MFTCKSCSRRIIQAIFSTSSKEHAAVLQPRIFNVLHHNPRKSRFATTSAKLRPERTSEERARIDAGLPIDIQTYEEAGIAALKGNTAIQKFQNTHNADPDRLISQNVSVWDGKTHIDRAQLYRHANLELKHIKEPYRLAERCLALLKNGEFDLTVHLVRQAGWAGMDATVSWNHILNATTKAGLLMTAYKLYHEMKKRGQKPDAYTYSILLRGYSAKTPLSNADLARARKIYESLYLPNSPVKPNIIHSNIMLELCARAGALDLLFKVGSQLSERGPNSPDQITYTTIFNALSNAKSSDSPSQVESQNESRIKLISQARRIWLDVIEKWKSGSLLLGEELVCSMGRVLLMSPLEEDHYTIFTLLEEFMRIPRQSPGAKKESLPKPRLQSEMEESKHARIGVPLLADHTDVQGVLEMATVEESRSVVDSTSNLDPNSQMLSEFGSSPAAITSANGSAQSKPSPRQHSISGHEMKSLPVAGLVFSKPGGKTLSLLLATCAKLSKFKVANAYWDLLSSQFTPDTFNFIEYMRMLKISSNSSKATLVLRDVYKLSRSRKSTIQLHPAMWEHGMAACQRTNNSKVALRDATRILVMLQMSTAEPSFNVIEMFTKVLSRTEANFPVEDIMRAEESLMMAFGNFKSLYAFGRTETNGPPATSETLDKLMSEIDPEWQPVAKPSYRLSMSRIDLLTEARSRLSMEERKGIRDLGRRIEIALGTVIKMYEDVMSHDQVARVRSDLYRVRAWVFPRNLQLLDEVMEENATKEKDQQVQGTGESKPPRRSKVQYRSSPHIGSLRIAPGTAA